MRILDARIFLSLLAGKFNHFQTDVTEKQSLNNLSMRVANTRIFWRENKIFEQPFAWKLWQRPRK